MKPDAYASNETIFIGTSHIDPDGYSRLLHMLETTGPDLVLVEVSPLSILLRRTYGRICRMVLDRNLKKTGCPETAGIRSIKKYFDIPCEYLAVRDYCKKTGALYRTVDVSIFSLARFFHAYKLVTQKNIAAAATATDDTFKRERGIASRIFNNNDSLLREMKLKQFRNDPLAMRRERILLRRTMKYAASCPEKRIVYAGGWEHMIDDPGSVLLFSAFTMNKKRVIIFINGQA